MAPQTPFIIFLLLFLPVLGFTQGICFDENLDCSQTEPVAFEMAIPVTCGDTVALAPTTEVCNTWSTPFGLNEFFGTGPDSSTLFVVIDQCSFGPIVVDGLTTTDNGSGSATCNTEITYLLVRQDTISQFLSCDEFLVLEEETETIESPCGCGDLVIAYETNFNDCVDCGFQCIYITGTTTITGGETEGAEVLVTYVLDGDTAQVARGDWTGEVDQLDCYSADAVLEILQVQAFLPDGASGSASADAWIVSNPGVNDTTFLFRQTCSLEEVGVLTDTLLSSTGCDSLLVTTVELDVLPEASVSDQYICQGEPAVLFADTGPGASFAWNTGASTSFIEVSDPGLYSVTVTGVNGCSTVASGEVVVNDIDVNLLPSVAEPLLLSEEPLEVWQGTAVEMSVEVIGTDFPFEIIWNGGPEIGDSIFNYIARETDLFKVAVVDSLGCIAFDETEILVRPLGVFVPSAFSPNEDGNNDSFDIYTSPNVEEVRLQIFTRRGDLLFDESLLPGMLSERGLMWLGWDGLVKGQTLNPQVLVYQLTFRAIRGEWQVIAGDVTLIR